MLCYASPVVDGEYITMDDVTAAVDNKDVDGGVDFEGLIASEVG